MPIYTLINNDTQEVFEKIMKIAEYEEYIKENSNVQRYYDTTASIGDPVKLGIRRPPSDFMHGVIGRMQNSIPGNNLKDAKFQLPREW